MKVSELMGAQLDYWTARADGILAEQLSIHQVPRGGPEICFITFKPGQLGTCRDARLNYSEDWAQGGPLIEKYRVDLFNGVDFAGDLPWKACVGVDLYEKANTPLQAICRAVVRAAFGDEVDEVPVRTA